MFASLPFYPTPISQLQYLSTPRLTQALSSLGFCMHKIKISIRTILIFIAIFAAYLAYLASLSAMSVNSKQLVAEFQLTRTNQTDFGVDRELKRIDNFTCRDDSTLLETAFLRKRMVLIYDADLAHGDSSDCSTVRCTTEYTCLLYTSPSPRD